MTILAVLVAAFPLSGSLAALVTPRARPAGWAALAGGTLALAGATLLAVHVLGGPPVRTLHDFVYVDGLGGFFLVTVALVIFLASLGSAAYLRVEEARGTMRPRQVRAYFVFFGLFAATMLGAVETGNLGLLFVLVEASTLASVVLVALEGRPAALAAGWKYVIISSLGITIALVGTLFVYYAATALPGTPDQHLTWAFLVRHASQLRVTSLRLGFLLAVVGYGTKVGLAPMHTWLPDAHAEAPGPASALLSGALLNVAMYAVIRFLAIADRGLGPAYGSHVLLVFGFLSALVGALFIVRRGDFKRLFAYSSVEHMGIIAIGLGFGGVLGLYGALLHTLNHAIGKALLFLSGGTVVLAYGTRRAERVTGVLATLPVTGAALLLGALAIVGSPPFGLFLSELTIVRGGLAAADPALVALLLLLLVIVFVAFMRTVAGMALGPRLAAVVTPYRGRPAQLTAALPLALSLLALLVLGLWIPGLVNSLIWQSIRVIR